MTTVRLGTRASKLAMAQTNTVAELIRNAHAGVVVEIVEITTAGDSDQSSSLLEGVGWFTTAIQQALLRGEVDAAVHSYKDLPTAQPAGLFIAAVPLREDPRDALVTTDGAGLRQLGPGARVGTSSPRRAAQLRLLRPDLELRAIRGNVDTRLAKVRNGEYEGTVLALAGLRRLGLEHEAAQVFDLTEMLPAPAQGALAIECRADDAATKELLESINDRELQLTVRAERGFLATLEAGCHFPAAAHATLSSSDLRLEGLLAPANVAVRLHIEGPAATAAALGDTLARELMLRVGMSSPGSTPAS